MGKRKKRRTMGKAGTTMVEVLVAFLVVMIMMGMFAKCVQVSSNMLTKTKAAFDRVEAFDEEYYKTSARDERKSVSGEISISVDTQKTDSVNHVKDAKLKLGLGEFVLYEDDAAGMKRYSFSHR